MHQEWLGDAAKFAWRPFGQSTQWVPLALVQRRNSLLGERQSSLLAECRRSFCANTGQAGDRAPAYRRALAAEVGEG